MNEAVPSVVAIDIGTHKVSVLIGKVHAPDNIQVIGMATARNRGMNKGKIVSLDKVITAIKNAVQEAEDMAECRVHSAWVSIPSAELKSFYASGRTPVENTDHTITTSEVVRSKSALHRHVNEYYAPMNDCLHPQSVFRPQDRLQAAITDRHVTIHPQSHRNSHGYG
jgi:cell division protein FtsA